MSSLVKQVDVESGQPEAPVKQRNIDNQVRVVFAVLFYMGSSMALVFLNKQMFSKVGKEFPLFVTWWQFVVALVLIYVGGHLGRWQPQFRFFAPLQFRSEVAVSIAPVTGIFIGMVVLNNLCLKYVDVSFYQTARSLTIVFSVILTYVVLNTKTSMNALACCVVVMIGFGAGSFGEINFSLLGWGFGIASSVFVAMYGIYVKKALNVLNNDKDTLLNYNTILSVIMLLPLILLSGEAQIVMSDPNMRLWRSWIELTISGVFGLLINVATYLQISYTSALTHNISGTVKACLQTILGILLLGETKSMLGYLGIFLVIGGSAAYTYVRKMEQDAREAANIGGK